MDATEPRLEMEISNEDNYAAVAHAGFLGAAADDSEYYSDDPDATEDDDPDTTEVVDPDATEDDDSDGTDWYVT